MADTNTTFPNRMEDMHAFPFPLADGNVATLWLPRPGLRRADAERLAEYIAALVTEEN